MKLFSTWICSLEKGVITNSSYEYECWL